MITPSCWMLPSPTQVHVGGRVSARADGEAARSDPRSADQLEDAREDVSVREAGRREQRGLQQEHAELTEVSEQLIT